MAKNIGIEMGWAAIGRFGKMGIMFVANVILARLLSPVEFGTLGLLLVFIGFSEVFIDGGLASALIQRGSPTHNEYSGVFYFNITISIICYVIIYIFAPYFSEFFKDPVLTKALRVIGIVLIINAFGIIQTTQLQISLSFKKLSLLQIVSNAIGTVSAIIFAYKGYGIWSLVYRNLISCIILNSSLWIYSSWRPKLGFALFEIKGLFRFGFFMFLSTFFEYIYAYIQPILIGKFFSVSELGNYSQARKLQEIPANSISGIVTSVAFPVLSKIKDDQGQFYRTIKNSLEKIVIVSFPIMIWMTTCADDLIIILFGEKWRNAIPLLQIISIAGIFRIPSALNMCSIKSKGKSKIFFITQIFKRILGIGCVLIGLIWGIYGLMWGFVAGSVLFFVIDSIVVGRYTGYGLIKQTFDVLPCILICFWSILILTFFNSIIEIDNRYVSFIIESTIYIIIYFVTGYFLKLPGWLFFIDKCIKVFKHGQ